MYLRYDNRITYLFGIVTFILCLVVSPIISPIANEITNPNKKPVFTLINIEAIKEDAHNIEEVVMEYVQDTYDTIRTSVGDLIHPELVETEEERISLSAHTLHPNSVDGFEKIDDLVPETTAAYFPEETRESESKSVLKKGSRYVPEYEYGRQPQIPIEIPEPLSDTDMRNYIGYVNTSEYLYLGEYRITGYTPGCSHCCGSSHGVTTSGNVAKVGYTVAAERNLPLGITLYIEGYGFYVVQDRGNLRENTIDIASPTHESCYDITKNRVNVYVVPLDSTTINSNYDE